MFSVESEMKNNQNKLCYFLAFFPPEFLHFCRMTMYHRRAKLKLKNNVYHCIPQTYHIKVGFDEI